MARARARLDFRARGWRLAVKDALLLDVHDGEVTREPVEAPQGLKFASAASVIVL